MGWGGGLGGRDRLGSLLGALGGFSLAVLGASWAVLGAFWFVLQRLGPSGGSSWGGVGAISARLEAILGPDAAKLDNCPGRLENGSGC